MDAIQLLFKGVDHQNVHALLAQQLITDHPWTQLGSPSCAYVRGCRHASKPMQASRVSHHFPSGSCHCFQTHPQQARDNYKEGQRSCAEDDGHEGSGGQEPADGAQQQRQPGRQMR